METKDIIETHNVSGNASKKQLMRQKGFTLVELIVVVVILGIVALIVASALGGGTNAANAQAVRSTASELSRAVGFLNVNMGTGTDTSASNPMTATTSNMLDVLVQGQSAVHADYQDRFRVLNMRPLRGQISGTAPNYRLMDYPISFQSCSIAPAVINHEAKVCVRYDNVPVEVVREIANKENVTYAATALTNQESVAWTAATGGRHSVVIARHP